MKATWRLIAVGLALVLLVSLIAACGGDEEATPTPEPTPAPTEAPTPEPTEAPTPEPTEAPTPGQLPSSLSVVDELQGLLEATDRDAQIAAFGALSTAINEIGDPDLDNALRQVVIKGGQSDEAGGEATLDMVALVLGQFADASAAFPAGVQPKIDLNAEIAALRAAADADKPAAFGALGAAIAAIGDSELSALFQNVPTAGAQSALAGTMALTDLIASILYDAADAAI